MTKELPLHIEIITPTGYLFSGSCHIAIVPAANGEMGIMSHHESLITSLKAGKIKLLDDKQNLIEEFEITSGFAEVLEDKLLALVDSVQPSTNPLSSLEK